MSGHSKWATIKRSKAAIDAKRSRIFSRITREMVVAVRDGGPDPNTNVRLRLAISSAKSANMPGENIERAIRRGSGTADGGITYEEVTYEANGPSNISLIIACATDNRNRTVAEVRTILKRYGGSIADPGSVLWNFDRRGRICAAQADHSEDEWTEIALEAGAEDIFIHDDHAIIYTLFESLSLVHAELEKKSIIMTSAEPVWLCKSPTQLPDDPEVLKKIDLFLSALEDHDDVQHIFHSCPDDDHSGN